MIFWKISTNANPYRHQFQSVFPAYENCFTKRSNGWPENPDLEVSLVEYVLKNILIRKFQKSMRRPFPILLEFFGGFAMQVPKDSEI